MSRAPGSDLGLPALDSLGMLEATAGLADQVATAAAAGAGVTGLPVREQIENVVVLGMGGSGVAGDVLVGVAGPYLPVPVTVVKSYLPPAFVGPASLVFAVSFSGDTEETVEAAEEALAQQGRLVVVTGGGRLEEMARRAEAPLVRVPRDVPQPRAAIGSMAIPLLVILERIGLFPGATHWIDLAVLQLRRRREELLSAASPAAVVAERIGWTVPLVHSSATLGAAAALRWKTQVNENAKRPAFWALYPELCHNEVAGWGGAGVPSPLRGGGRGEGSPLALTVVNLRHDSEHPQMGRRFALVGEVLAEAGAGVCEVRAEGEGELAQLLDLVLIGDFVSLHLAAIAGADPGPIPVLDRLKARLQEG